MNIRVDVPEGKSGEWSVERFTVSKEDVDRQCIRAIATNGRYVPEGTYTHLKCGNEIIMSDTPDEIRDHMPFRWNARGNVLVNGLGLGMVIEMVIERVDHITVIEKSPDVITLVAPHYVTKYPGKVEIIQCDAFDYTPPKGIHYDAVWHDIWDNICSDNLDDMIRLHRKYGRRANWQGSWARWQCEHARASGF